MVKNTERGPTALNPPGQTQDCGKMPLGGWSPLGEPVDALKLK